MLSTFGRLDKEKGSLRLLITILYNIGPVTKGELRGILRRQEVGGTAFESSLDTLKDLGLVKDKNETNEGKRVIFSYLTEKGHIIAEKLIEIQKILND
jgi:DNA-binding MarR family transcriptional regulator